MRQRTTDEVGLSLILPELISCPAHVAALVLRMGVEYVESHVAVLVTDPHPAAGDEFLLVPVPATVSVSGRLRVLPASLTT